MIEKYENKILQGDCLELFKNIPDNSIDITFADSPFNLKKKYKSYKDSLEFQKYLEWCKEWINEMVRVTKPTGSIFLHNIPKWLSFYVGFLNEVSDFKHSPTVLLSPCPCDFYDNCKFLNASFFLIRA